MASWFSISFKACAVDAKYASYKLARDHLSELKDRNRVQLLLNQRNANVFAQAAVNFLQSLSTDAGIQGGRQDIVNNIDYYFLLLDDVFQIFSSCVETCTEAHEALLDPIYGRQLLKAIGDMLLTATATTLDPGNRCPEVMRSAIYFLSVLGSRPMEDIVFASYSSALGVCLNETCTMRTDTSTKEPLMDAACTVVENYLWRDLERCLRIDTARQVLMDIVEITVDFPFKYCDKLVKKMITTRDMAKHLMPYMTPIRRYQFCNYLKDMLTRCRDEGLYVLGFLGGAEGEDLAAMESNLVYVARQVTLAPPLLRAQLLVASVEDMEKEMSGESKKILHHLHVHVKMLEVVSMAASLAPALKEMLGDVTIRRTHGPTTLVQYAIGLLNAVHEVGRGREFTDVTTNVEDTVTITENTDEELREAGDGEDDSETGVEDRDAGNDENTSSGRTGNTDEEHSLANTEVNDDDEGDEKEDDANDGEKKHENIPFRYGYATRFKEMSNLANDHLKNYFNESCNALNYLLVLLMSGYKDNSTASASTLGVDDQLGLKIQEMGKKIVKRGNDIAFIGNEVQKTLKSLNDVVTRNARSRSVRHVAENGGQSKGPVLQGGHARHNDHQASSEGIAQSNAMHPGDESRIPPTLSMPAEGVQSSPARDKGDKAEEEEGGGGQSASSRNAEEGKDVVGKGNEKGEGKKAGGGGGGGKEGRRAKRNMLATVKGQAPKRVERAHPAFLLRCDLLRLLAVLTYRNKTAQDYVRKFTYNDRTGLELILAQSEGDKRNPHLPVWAALALISLIRDNKANVRSLCFDSRRLSDLARLMRVNHIVLRVHGDEVTFHKPKGKGKPPNLTTMSHKEPSRE